MSGSCGRGPLQIKAGADDHFKVRVVSSDPIITAARASLKARDKIPPKPAALDTMESSFLTFCHMEKTNDQSDLRVGRADRGSRIHNSSPGCPQQRCHRLSRSDRACGSQSNLRDLADGLIRAMEPMERVAVNV
jgi:hypothetical protein